MFHIVVGSQGSFLYSLPLDRGKKITGNQPTANNEDGYQIFVPFYTRGVMHKTRSSQEHLKESKLLWALRISSITIWLFLPKWCQVEIQPFDMIPVSTIIWKLCLLSNLWPRNLVPCCHQITCFLNRASMFTVHCNKRKTRYYLVNNFCVTTYNITS